MDKLVPIPRYTRQHRAVLREMIISALEMGVDLPADMPCDTEEHMAMAIVMVARLCGRNARALTRGYTMYA